MTTRYLYDMTMKESSPNMSVDPQVESFSWQYLDDIVDLKGYC